jgi:hypothetical protein
MLPGRTDAQGRLFVTTAAIAANATYQEGIPISPLGQVYVDINTPQKFVNGIGVTNAGKMCINNVGPSVNWQAGIPLVDGGAIFCQLNQTPNANDPYVGGVRIGPNGGVYIIDSTPAAPVNTTPPVLSGTAAVGQKLTCTPGVWTGTPNPFLTYHWERDGQHVGIDNTIEYLVTSADVGHGIACIENANNLVGSKELATNIISIP